MRLGVVDMERGGVRARGAAGGGGLALGQGGVVGG